MLSTGKITKRQLFEFFEQLPLTLCFSQGDESVRICLKNYLLRCAFFLLFLRQNPLHFLLETVTLAVEVLGFLFVLRVVLR